MKLEKFKASQADGNQPARRRRIRNGSRAMAGDASSSGSDTISFSILQKRSIASGTRWAYERSMLSDLIARALADFGYAPLAEAELKRALALTLRKNFVVGAFRCA